MIVSYILLTRLTSELFKSVNKENCILKLNSDNKTLSLVTEKALLKYK